MDNYCPNCQKYVKTKNERCPFCKRVCFENFTKKTKKPSEKEKRERDLRIMEENDIFY